MPFFDLALSLGSFAHNLRFPSCIHMQWILHERSSLHAQFCAVAMQSTAAKAKAKAEKEDSKDGHH